MERKKFSIFYIIVGILIIFLIIGAYKNLNDHHDKEYLVVNNKILESAKECYLKKDCTGEITLKDLYSKGYLETQINPVTKENMNENLCIKYENGETFFC